MGSLRVRMQEILNRATGGAYAALEKDFLQRYWLMENIRTYGAWRRRRNNPGRLELAVHLSDPGILFDMTTGRIDPIELLTCDDLRFTVEVTDEANALLSESYQCEGTVMLNELVRELQLLRSAGAGRAPGRWLVEVDPSPTGRPHMYRLDDAALRSKNLAEFGVLTDSVLRFVRVSPADAAASAGSASPPARKRPARARRARSSPSAPDA